MKNTFKERFNKIDISDCSKVGRCKAKCEREVIRSKDGNKLVCNGCKRILKDLPLY